MNAPDDIDRAIAYCDTLAPGFSARIRGASAQQLDALAELQGRPLDLPHRRFLETMGGSTGGLDFKQLDTSAQGLLTGLGATYGTPVAGFELFAVAEDEPYRDLYLVARDQERALESMNSRIGTTHASLAGDSGSRVAATIAEFVCHAMLRQAVTDHLPHRQGYLLQRQHAASAPEPTVLDALDRIAAKLGLAQLWFSSPTTRFHVADGTVIIARQTARQPFTVTVMAKDREAIADTDEALVRALDLKRLRSR
ncbi:hypothetical protein HSX11_24550 [Oxalobacteraceae bacterium]|nr:hypothetical protein [Oxalobacteraceae bacterium]